MMSYKSIIKLTTEQFQNLGTLGHYGNLQYIERLKEKLLGASNLYRRTMDWLRKENNKLEEENKKLDRWREEANESIKVAQSFESAKQCFESVSNRKFIHSRTAEGMLKDL